MTLHERRPIHVLHVVPGLEPGGLEIAMARLIRGLDGPAMRHSIICLKGEAVIRDQLPPSVPIYCMHATPNEPQLPWRLLRLIHRIRPTVIHARNWSAWADVAVARLAMWPPVPLIFSFHGFARPEDVPRRRRIAFRVLSRMTTHLFTVSESARQMLISRMGWPARGVEVIPNGVDTDRFTPRANTLASEPSSTVIPSEHSESRNLAVNSSDSPRPIVIGTVGGLKRVKNQSLLVAACADLVAAGAACRLRIAGEGPERDRLASLAAELGIADRVALVGHVSDVPAFLQQVDIFALPSLSEAHPNALLEAMATGLPCVASSVGGAAEVLGGGRLGRLVDPSDRAGLAAALAELARDAALRRTLGEASRLHVAEHYAMSGMIAAYRELYGRASRDRFRHDGAVPPDPARRPRVLMTGPLPPLTGGMATVVDNLRRSPLRKTCRLTVRSTGKITPEHRSLASGVTAQLKIFADVVGQIVARRAEIVHIHTCALFTFWRDILHMTAARALGSSVVWHIHDGTFLPFFSQGPSVKRSAIRLALRAGGAVIVLSRTAADALRPLAPEVPWRVVNNGAELPPLAAATALAVAAESALTSADAAAHADGQVRILFLGNLTRRKGAYDLVDALALAGRSGFRGVARLAGGEVQAGQRAELVEYIKAAGCSDRVELLGLIGGPRKEQALADADCLALPSYAEGLPMAVLEGMAYGLPVLATRIGAIPEVITDGREGYLFAPGDVATLADRLARLGRDGDLRRTMGRAARARVEEEYSLDVMATRIRDIYEDVLRRRRRGGRSASPCRRGPDQVPPQGRATA
jgi:glycosyltransferase involved in cell wall biosynthesis